MDEGRERNQVSVAETILGPGRSLMVADTYSAFDPESGFLFWSTDRAEVELFVGSEREH